MDKTARIVAAALFAAGLTQATPALSVQTTAQSFMQGLSSDFAAGNYGGVQAKLDSLKNSGFQGIIIDNQMVSVARLSQILGQARLGNIDPDKVAAQLRELVAHAGDVRFIVGDVRVGSADLRNGNNGNQGNQGSQGSVFPAGSAG